MNTTTTTTKTKNERDSHKTKIYTKTEQIQFDAYPFSYSDKCMYVCTDGEHFFLYIVDVKSHMICRSYVFPQTTIIINFVYMMNERTERATKKK